MELWLLGAGVIVLIAITLLLVWPEPSAEIAGASVRNQEDTRMMPQGDEFEDQYTSATADLSAGGVATALNTAGEAVAETPVPTAYGAAAEAWSSPTLAHEGVAATPGSAPSMPPTPIAPQAQQKMSWGWSTEPPPGRWATPAQRTPMTVGIGAAALLTLGGVVAGAWLYARWQSRRNAPLNRLRRRLHDARGQLR
jgi:hypothetical protein